MKNQLRLFTLLTLLLSLPTVAFGLTEADIANAVVELPNGTTREIACVSGKAGIVNSRGGRLRFRDYKRLARKQNQRFKKSGSKKAKNRARLFRRLSSLGGAACENLQGDQPNPPSTGNPTPTPPPSGDIPTSYFNADGTVNEFGKVRFGIPANMEANIIDGMSAFSAFCTGCHGERTKPSFAELRVATSQPPMLYNEDELPDQDLVNILAYLGRFESPFNDGLR